MENLNIRYLYLYNISIYLCCSNIENSLHLLICPKNNINLHQVLTDIIQTTLMSLQITNNSSQTFLNILLNFTANLSNPQYNFILYAITGIFSTTIYKATKILLKKQTNSFFNSLANNLLSWFYQDL
jgi:hypothetical protein